MIRVLAALALMLFLAPAPTQFEPMLPDPALRSQIIKMTPVPLNGEDRSQEMVGDLRYISGWEMTSDNPNFGGISALIALPDGRFLGLSDAGVLIGFGLDDAGKVRRSFIARLPSQGPSLPDKEDNDSESMTYDPDSGRFWVGYEQVPSIRRFGRGFARLEATGRPAAMQDWTSNAGAEAMVRFPDGRFLVFSEHVPMPDKRGKQAVMFASDPSEPGAKAEIVRYKPPDGYSVTDATLLPDGRVIILHRALSVLTGISAKITIADPADIRRDEIWRGREIATLEAPLTVDNMEGIAVTQSGGDIIVWLASDDNFSVLQRTLLLKFRLEEERDYQISVHPEERLSSRAAA